MIPGELLVARSRRNQWQISTALWVRGMAHSFDVFFQLFLAFFYPHIYNDIDRSVPLLELLDKESFD